MVSPQESESEDPQGRKGLTPPPPAKPPSLGMVPVSAPEAEEGGRRPGLYSSASGEAQAGEGRFASHVP